MTETTKASGEATIETVPNNINKSWTFHPQKHIDSLNIEIDEEMVELVEALNKAGLRTTHSCQGGKLNGPREGHVNEGYVLFEKHYPELDELFPTALISEEHTGQLLEQERYVIRFPRDNLPALTEHVIQVLTS